MHTITIEGPGKNALGSELMQQLIAGFEAADGAPVLLTGAGDAFSAGLNLKELLELDLDGMRGFLERLGTLAALIFDYPGPVVACVNGHAIAGGCVLALCCDWRVGTSSPKARIGLNEVALGLRFPQRLLRMLRHQLPRLEQVALDAGLYAPDQALALGLLDELADDPLARAQERLAARAKHPAAAYAAAKASLRAGVAVRVEAEEEAFLRDVVPAWVTPEVKAIVRKALGK